MIEAIVTYLADALGLEGHSDGVFHWPWQRRADDPAVRYAREVVYAYAPATNGDRQTSRKRVCPFSGTKVSI